MRNNIIQYTIDCDSCGQQHQVKIDHNKLTKWQLEGREPVLSGFECPDVARMYRAVKFTFDARVNIFKRSEFKEQQEAVSLQLKNEWGPNNFDSKLKRFIELDLAFIGIPEEYYELLWPVVSSYCCGYFYPAMTSSGSLGERILNRLLLKTREYFKSSAHYKKVWNKNSFDQWDNVINILKDWGIISDKVGELFTKLKKYRNDSIHYNEGYDFESNSHIAVKTLAEIINHQFNYINRKDIFWVFDIPGEIWLKSNTINDPFVKEFVLQNCIELTPYCEPTAKPQKAGQNAPLKPLSDEEFIQIRNNRNK